MTPSRQTALRLWIGNLWAVLALATASLGCQSSGDYNRVFHRSQGWWYSDGGSSARLPDGRTVWLFGDTWLRHNENLLFNSMAVQDTEPGRAPRSGEIRFFARDASGSLVDVTTTADPARRSWMEPQSDGNATSTWLWPSATLAVGGKLVATYAEVGCVKGKFPDCRISLTNMGLMGHVVAEVDNPTDEPERWRIHTTSLRDRRGLGPIAHRLHWGSALIEDAGWLYVFGIALGDHSEMNDVKLARVLPEQVARYDLWQFLTPEGWQMLPTGATPQELSSLTRGGATELSVHRVVHDGEPCLVMVQVDPYASELIVRTAPDRGLEAARWAGPEEGAGVRRFSLAKLDPKTAGGMVWAGRAHPHLSGNDTMLVSFFSERIHSLRFLELPLSRVVAPLQ